MLLDHVLSVDDNRIMQDIHGDIFKHFSKKVSVAMSGQEAIDMIKRDRFDLILLDLHMPKMNGIDTAKAIRASGVNTPIIAVTGNDATEDRAACQAVGINGFVPKPIDDDLLLDEIKRLCH